MEPVDNWEEDVDKLEQSPQKNCKKDSDQLEQNNSSSNFGENTESLFIDDSDSSFLDENIEFYKSAEIQENEQEEEQENQIKPKQKIDVFKELSQLNYKQNHQQIQEEDSTNYSCCIQISEEELIHFISIQLFAKISIKPEFSNVVFSYKTNPLRVYIGDNSKAKVMYLYNKFYQYMKNNEFGIIESRFQDLEIILKHQNILQLKKQKLYVQLCNQQSIMLVCNNLEDKFGIKQVKTYFQEKISTKLPVWLIIGTKNNFDHIYDMVNESIKDLEISYCQI